MISGMTFPSVVGSGEPLPASALNSRRVFQFPKHALRQQSWFSVYVVPTLSKPETVLAMISPSELEEIYTNHAGRFMVRERRGGYNAAYRCFNCHLFVSGKEARCAACGYEHGGVFHDAVASR